MPNETLDPSDVGPLGVQRFVPYPQLAPHLLDDRRLGGVDPADQMPLVLHARPARTKSRAPLLVCHLAQLLPDRR